jgi:hypothetical protein
MRWRTNVRRLRIMGYDTGPCGDHCAHGFRSIASTLLNEEGAFGGDVVESPPEVVQREVRVSLGILGHNGWGTHDKTLR